MTEQQLWERECRRDRSQDDTDAGMFAAMFEKASPREWARFAAVLLTQP